MTPDNLALLIEELRFDEGVQYWPYRDAVGVMTTGVGHNMEAHPLPPYCAFPLSNEMVDRLLADDLQSVFDDLNGNLPWWTDLNDVRQRVLCNMCFNLGIGKLLGFRNTLAAMRQGRYADAAKGMLNSAWATQVGKRAKRLADMMEKGAKP
jgi:lysozyme